MFRSPKSPSSRRCIAARVLAIGTLTLACSQALAQQPAPQNQQAAQPQRPQSQPVTTTPAQNQQTQPAPAQTGAAELDTVVVTGEALSLQRAIAEKRDLDVISDGVSADEVGTIPDYGLGEALERVPGVSAELNNGRGEAQFITIRGLNADYNAVTIDGVRLPSTETGKRNISLDILPSSLGQQMNVYKSFDAVNSANAIGGIIDVRTRSPFDNSGRRHAAMRASYGWYENQRTVASSRPSGIVDAAYSNTFGADGNWGVVLAASYFRRDSSTLITNSTNYRYYRDDGVRLPMNSPDLATAIPLPDRRRWYAYDNVRDRTGIFAKLQYDNFENFSAGLTGGWFRHQNDEQRWGHVLLQRIANYQLETPETGYMPRGQADTQVAWFNQDRQIRYLAAHAAMDVSDVSKVTLVASRGRGSIEQTELNSVFQTRDADESQLGFFFDAPSGGTPYFRPENPDFYFNPDNYFQVDYLNGSYSGVEDNRGLTLRFNHNFDQNTHGFGFIVGTDLDKIDREFDFERERWLSQRANTIPMGQMLSGDYITPWDGRGQRFDAIDGNKLNAFFQANPQLYRLDPANLHASIGSDYRLKEKVNAGYVLGGYRGDDLVVRVGVRNERTNLHAFGLRRDVVDGRDVYSPQWDRNSYSHWLPSVNVGWRIRPDLHLRGAYSQTVSRADYNALVSRDYARFNANDDLIITRGNPYLKPRVSTNYDLSMEWYFSPRSILSLGLFRKEISDEVATVTSTTEGPEYDTIVTQPVNIDSAKVDGLEFNYVQTSFDFLPGYLKNFGMSFNATWLNMDGGPLRMTDGSVRQLPALLQAPEQMYNLSLLWRHGDFNGRLSYKHTGDFPILYDNSNIVYDRWYRNNRTWDLHLGYRVNRQLRATVQAKNLTNERPARMYGPNHEQIRELIDNGRSVFVGFNYVF